MPAPIVNHWTRRPIDADRFDTRQADADRSAEVWGHKKSLWARERREIPGQLWERIAEHAEKTSAPDPLQRAEGEETSQPSTDQETGIMDKTTQSNPYTKLSEAEALEALGKFPLDARVYHSFPAKERQPDPVEVREGQRQPHGMLVFDPTRNAIFAFFYPGRREEVEHAMNLLRYANDPSAVSMWQKSSERPGSVIGWVDTFIPYNTCDRKACDAFGDRYPSDFHICNRWAGAVGQFDVLLDFDTDADAWKLDVSLGNDFLVTADQARDLVKAIEIGLKELERLNRPKPVDYAANVSADAAGGEDE